MANNSPTIVAASLSDDQLKKSIDSLVTHVDEAMKKMVQSTNNAVGEMEAKLKSLGNLKIDSGGTADGGSSRRTSSVEKETKARKELSMTLDQQASAINTAVQSEKKYTDEVIRQAAAIRSSKEWQEKGHVVVGDVNYYDKERANASKRDKQLLLSLEEQIVQAQQNEAEAARRATQETRNQAQAQQQVQQSALGTARIIERVHEMQKRANGLIGKDKSVPTFTVELESAKRLSDRLKELREQYNNMNFGQRFGKEGQAIAQQIREITRQGQILNNQLNRPTKKEVFGLSEKTLDDIAYKMRQLASYRSGLNIGTQRNEIEQVNKKYAQLQKNMNDIMQKNTDMIASNTALGRSWNYMKNRLAFYFTVGASTQFVKNLIEIRSQYEMNERALGILIDSAERGSKIFNELSQMALVSPYTLIELSTAAKQLTAYDVAAKDVVDTTRRLADMTAAVGIPIERLTYALGQIKAYGYLNARDARMFSNAGIPLVKQLSDYYTELEGRLVSTADVYDRIKKKAIGYNDVMSVVYKMTDEGGKFFDFQAKMADTLKVQLANLTLAWNNMLNDIGESNQGLLTGGIKAMKELFLHWKQFNKIANDMVVIVGTLAATHIMMNVVFGKSTSLAITRAVAMQKVSQADAKAILSAKNLSASQLKLLVSLNRTNKEFVTSVANLNKLTMSQIQAATKANVLKTSWYAMAATARLAASAVATLAESLMAIAPQIAIFAVTMAVVDMIRTINDGRESVKELNRTIVDNAKESAKAIKETIDTLNESGVNKDTVSSLPVEEQKKAWDEIRERIELSSASSEKFISMLMKEVDLSKRVALGLSALESIEKAHDLMALWHDDTIEVSEDFKILGIGADGLTEDLSDFVKYMNQSSDGAGELIEKSDTLEGTWRQILSWVYDFSDLQANLGFGTLNPSGWFKNIGDWMGFDFLDSEKAKFTDAYKEVQSEIDKTYESLYNQIEKDGVKSADVVYEMISKTISNIATERKWSEQETLTARLLLEQRFATSDVDIFRKSVADKNTAWEAWMNYLTKMHKTEFSNMANEEITEESWAQDKRKKLYEETFEKFKEYNALAYDLLKDSVNKANLLQVHIKVFYDNQNTLTDVEQDFRARTGYLENSEYYNDFAKGAKSQVDIVDKVKKAQKEKAAEVKTAEKAGLEYSKENLDRLKKENEELIKIIHSYGALTDAEEKAKGKKRDPMLDALKQTVDIVKKLQSEYDSLTKSGASSADALDDVRKRYSRTIAILNNNLQGFGLPQLNLEMIKGRNPNDVLEYFQKISDILTNKGLSTLERQKAVEVVIQEFSLKAKTYNLDMITKGLNNELGKLKDEYELAVELDADPELGNAFAEMFGIDRSQLPSNIYDYIQYIQDKADDAIQKAVALDPKAMIKPFDLLRDDINVWAEETGRDVNSELAKGLIASQNQAKGAMQKYTTDLYKQSKDLQYKLADTNGKIAIEEDKLAKLKIRLSKAVTDEERENLQLQIQDQENAIAKLKEGLLQELPAYKALFNGIAEHSAIMTRRLAQDYSNILNNAQLQYIDGNKQYKINQNGVDVYLSESTYYKEVKRANDELRKSASPLKKIKEAFTKGEDGAVDFWKGVELVNDEVKKLATLATEIGNFAQVMGFSEDTVEVINDVATSISGVATITDGLGQIASGDYIGGAASMLSGLTSIIGAWADNDNKRIDAEIKDSELAVKRLENAYKNLEFAIENAYGANAIGAKQAAIANKELQLAELKRQLALEKSRDSKDRDDDRIMELQGQIIDLQNDIKKSAQEIATEILGISSVGDAALSFMDAYISALRKGEDAQKAFTGSWKDMIANMIKQIWVTKVIGPQLEALVDEMNKRIKNRSKTESDAYEKAVEEQTRISTMSDDEIRKMIFKDKTGKNWDDYLLSGYDEKIAIMGGITQSVVDAYRKNAEERVYQAKKELDKATMPTINDLDLVAQSGKDLLPLLQSSDDDLNALLERYGLFEDQSDKTLSALQQGISQISEETAGAIEAYLNGVSQQVYLHSDLLTQIRDAVVGMDMDVQVATQAQMLLQLQQSYAVQMSIQGILEGVLTPSGRAFSVELAS